jgi:hypothetical protein
VSDSSQPFADRIVRHAAGGMSRRRLFRNTGAGALGLALSASFLGDKRAQVAQAHGSASHPCGPSPYCPSGRCYNGQCSNAAGRYYATYTCHPNHLGGCWTEDYRSTGHGYRQCCDCCAFDGGALPVPGAARGARAFVESDWADAVMALHAAATGALAIVLAVAQNTSG